MWHIPKSCKMAAKQNTCLELPTLGRSFQLGVLYDCRPDAIIPGTTLWDSEALKNNADLQPQPGTDTQLITADSPEDKAAALSIALPLKASVLSGLVDLKGSAEYLTYKSKSRECVRVTLLHRTSVQFEELNMANMGQHSISYPEVFDKGTATHVVTAVLHGAQVFLVFDCKVLPSENKDDIRRKLKLLIKNKLIDKGNGDLKEEETLNISEINCTFHGDFPLPKNPVTFQEAIDIYSTLPNLLGENGENAVPVKVWLHPLNDIDSRAAQLVHEIRGDLVDSLQAVLEELDEFEMLCTDMMKDEVTLKFSVFNKKLQQFKEFCLEYKLCFQKHLSRMIPLIRRGEETEDVIVDILKTREQSPFSKSALKAWLDDKDKEMAVVQSYVRMLNNLKMMSSEKKLIEEVLDPVAEHVVCFMFTSLQNEETYLSDLSNYLQSQNNENLPGQVVAPYDYEKQVGQQWFKLPAVSKRMRSYARLFLEFSKANAASEHIKFIVASKEDTDYEGASIYLYDEGYLENTNFEPLSKPDPPQILNNTHNSVTLKLMPPCHGVAEVEKYKVEYRDVEKEIWALVETPDKAEPFTVNGLLPNTQYQFRYSAVCKAGVSASSEISANVTTHPTSQSDSVTGSTEPDPPSKKECAVVRDRTGQGPYSTENIDTSQNTNRNKQNKGMGARSETNQYQGSVHTSQYERDPKHRKERYDTSQRGGLTDRKPRRLAEHVRNKMSRKSKVNSNTKLSLFNMSLWEEKLDKDGYCRRHTFGKASQKHNKTIMLIGATGAGKTTLINGMINYILGVEWEDNFRFVLIDEGKQKSQAESQTAAITAYKINHMNGFQVPYSLTIVDTPGFGDTRGIKHDQRITELVRDFFSQPGGIDQIDAVCFVTQSSLARLTHTQKYVFDSVLSIFGKDIADNIVMLVTFADGQKPPVLEAIKVSCIPCSRDTAGDPIYFKFNNSALFVDNTGPSKSASEDFQSNDFDKMFWKMGSASFSKFFNSLVKMETKSLVLTQEVLQERKQLEVVVEGLQPQINAGLTTLDEIKKTKLALEQHQAEMEANKDFEYEIEITKPVQVENTSGYITNCQNCHFTCHDHCIYANDKDKDKCSAMDKTGYCKICPGKCIWNVHFNQKYKWSYVITKEKKTYSELKERFEAAHGEVMTTENIFQKLENEFAAVQEIVYGLIGESHRCLGRLKEIALRPNPLSTPNYIDLMIESEKQEAKPGFQNRIHVLMEVRKRAEIMEKVFRGEVLPEEWQQYSVPQKQKGKGVFGTIKDWLCSAVGHALSSQSQPAHSEMNQVTHSERGNPRGGYNMQRGGRDSPRGAYNMHRGGRDSPRGAYNMQRGGRDSPRGAYSMQRGGMDSPRGAYNIHRGGEDSPCGGSNYQGTEHGRGRGREEEAGLVV
ncbi:uncharacterized protein LOC117400979 [Acipenser ruthenus]|uniref:uncharacterized protein LOC117400979 n=1 Tax=Acipenser ruthenus TaxID=7906 RepID=UPI002741CBDA|nr:uncharacterized protein LOC117400979 [Acipenser ruthenus]